jgi:hypothetical protein
MSTTWIALNSRFRAEDLGFLWDILTPDDKRPVSEQLETNYAHGGGYNPFDGFKLDRMTMSLKYPGDPAMKPSAMSLFGEEQVYFYPDGAWLLILQPDGKFVVTRVD